MFNFIVLIKKVPLDFVDCCEEVESNELKSRNGVCSGSRSTRKGSAQEFVGA